MIDSSSTKAPVLSRKVCALQEYCHSENAGVLVWNFRLCSVSGRILSDPHQEPTARGAHWFPLHLQNRRDGEFGLVGGEGREGRNVTIYFIFQYFDFL